jgi:hypothetical protein
MVSNKNHRRRITKKPMPRATDTTTAAGFMGDSVGDGQGVGILSVDFLIVVAVATGTAEVFSSMISRTSGVSTAEKTTRFPSLTVMVPV